MVLLAIEKACAMSLSSRCGNALRIKRHILQSALRSPHSGQLTMILTRPIMPSPTHTTSVWEDARSKAWLCLLPTHPAHIKSLPDSLLGY